MNRNTWNADNYTSTLELPPIYNICQLNLGRGGESVGVAEHVRYERVKSWGGTYEGYHGWFKVKSIIIFDLKTVTVQLYMMDEALTARPRSLPDNEKKIILLTTVDIGDGRSAKIEVREGEDPLVIAALFCQQNGLPDGIVGHLAVHILENLAQAVLEEVQEVDEVRSFTYYLSVHIPCALCQRSSNFPTISLTQQPTLPPSHTHRNNNQLLTTPAIHSFKIPAPCHLNSHTVTLKINI
jgi:hypothetical protein